jgi:hypothetical protein
MDVRDLPCVFALGANSKRPHSCQIVPPPSLPAQAPRPSPGTIAGALLRDTFQSSCSTLPGTASMRSISIRPIDFPNLPTDPYCCEGIRVRIHESIVRSHQRDKVQQAMASKVSELEKRVLLLEKELRELKERMESKRETPWYRQILGQFKDDAAFDEIVRLGRQIRESERKRAR